MESVAQNEEDFFKNFETYFCDFLRFLADSGSGKQFHNFSTLAMDLLHRNPQLGLFWKKIILNVQKFAQKIAKIRFFFLAHPVHVRFSPKKSNFGQKFEFWAKIEFLPKNQFWNKIKCDISLYRIRIGLRIK